MCGGFVTFPGFIRTSVLSEMATQVKESIMDVITDLIIHTFKVDNLPSYNRLNIVSPYGVARDDEPLETLK